MKGRPIMNNKVTFNKRPSLTKKQLEILDSDDKYKYGKFADTCPTNEQVMLARDKHRKKRLHNWVKERDDKDGVDYTYQSDKNMIGTTTRKVDVALRAFNDKNNKRKWLVSVGNWGTSLKIVKETKTKKEAVKFAENLMSKTKKVTTK